MKTYAGLDHLYGNVLAAVDFETTGGRPGYHEIVQIAVVPLGSDFEPHPDMRPFYTNIAPEYPERCDHNAMGVHQLKVDDLLLNAPPPGRVADLLDEWFKRLDLPIEKRLVPLAQNWSFESMFATAWLGPELKQSIFHHAARDPMLLAVAMNDRAAYAGLELPFPRIKLSSLCRKLKVTNDNEHDALSDALAAARVYRQMIQMDVI